MNLLQKIKEIKDGWGNYIFPSPEIEAMADARATICAGCPENVASICTKCGCPLASKTRSPQSKCPLSKW